MLHSFASPVLAAESNLFYFNLGAIPYMTADARQTPPGYPLGYVLITTTHSCKCGRSQIVDQLFTLDRGGGFGRRCTPTPQNAPIYDLPLTRESRYTTTPICSSCIDRTIKVAVPKLPPISAKLHSYDPTKDPTLDNKTKLKAPTSVADALTQYDFE